ncbi:predicted protein [Plenodomus lingam JN3]|uniref:Uncharacterized protein n=1 Tax=Leptosphaeria maculans (strain JN3 / isolate v23.1.3 / race Av1-4-5-6-7-8) TaxID=985895 RepID=E5A6C5_LEPMJ|nr:predicted protein [Plenodomus lingam JN3]CBX99170.1 predicted protein [Plenodomus lingam JN3]
MLYPSPVHRQDSSFPDHHIENFRAALTLAINASMAVYT